MVKRLFVISLLSGALVVPVTAEAATQVHRLTGKFHSETVPGTGKVSIKVIVKNGNPVALRELKFSNLPAACNKSEIPGAPSWEPAGTLSGGAGKNMNGDGIEFGRALFWAGFPQGGAREVLMNGKLSKSGKRINSGELQVNNNAPGACQSATGSFTARK
jgi:hypothetical protein